MTRHEAEIFYRERRADVDASRMKVPNAVIAVACGVGMNTVTAVRKMIGCAAVRKIFVKPVRDFLKRHPEFQIADATSERSRTEFAVKEMSEE